MGLAGARPLRSQSRFNPPEDGGSALQTPRRSGTTGFKTSIDYFLQTQFNFSLAWRIPFSIKGRVYMDLTIGANKLSSSTKKSNQKRKIGEIIAVLYSWQWALILAGILLSRSINPLSFNWIPPIMNCSVVQPIQLIRLALRNLAAPRERLMPESSSLISSRLL